MNKRNEERLRSFLKNLRQLLEEHKVDMEAVDDNNDYPAVDGVLLEFKRLDEDNGYFEYKFGRYLDVQGIDNFLKR